MAAVARQEPSDPGVWVDADATTLVEHRAGLKKGDAECFRS